MTLEEVRRIAMSLPSVTEEPHFTYTSFRVAGKIFDTAPPGGEHLHVFVDGVPRQLAMALEPESLEVLTGVSESSASRSRCRKPDRRW